MEFATVMKQRALEGQRTPMQCLLIALRNRVSDRTSPKAPALAIHSAGDWAVGERGQVNKTQEFVLSL